MKKKNSSKQASHGKKGGESYYRDDILILRQLKDYYKGKTTEAKRKN
jgi:hypothetical protein